MSTHLEFSEELEHMAKRLIDEYHPHLHGIAIAYLFKAKIEEDSEHAKRRGRGPSKYKKIKIAWAQLVSSKYRLLFSKDYRFLITADKEIWEGLSLAQRTAVVDHELCHCVVDDAGECKLRKHDIEDFTAVAQRHGLYLDDVRRFVEAAQGFEV